HLALTLNVNIQQQVIAALRCLIEHRFGCPIVVAKHIGIFKEFVVPDHSFELIAGYKVVFTAVLLASPGRARGIGNGKLQVRNKFAELIHQRGFPGAGWGGDNVENPAHSMFCTCSRHFSISDFISRPNSVMRSPSPATPEVFESRVLASRLSSCKRKSSFLPTSPP